MSRYSPNKFSDDHAFAKFFDWRCETFTGEGEDMMLLEYPDVETQQTIFRHALAPVDLSDQAILDVGCGLGYLKPYLDEHHLGYRSYLGVDLSERMVTGAVARWGDCFRRRDVFDERFDDNEFDYVTLLSVLGVRITDDPQAYMESLLRELFRISRKGSAVHEPCARATEARLALRLSRFHPRRHCAGAARTCRCTSRWTIRSGW